MGTNYYRPEKGATEADFEYICEGALAIAADLAKDGVNARVRIGDGPDGREIIIAGGLRGCEDFRVSRDELCRLSDIGHSVSVRARGADYDVVVKSVMAVIAFRLGGGVWANGQFSTWDRALGLCSRIFGYGMVRGVVPALRLGYDAYNQVRGQ